MQDLGLRFMFALNTGAALREIERQSFGCVISDMGREEGPREGYVLLDTLRERGDVTPFVIYAGSNSTRHKRETEEHGGQGCTNNLPELVTLVLRAICQPPLGMIRPAVKPRHESLNLPLTVPLRIERAVELADPNVSHGPWVNSLRRHTLSPTMEFRMALRPVVNSEFLQFVEDGGYERDDYWSPSAERHLYVNGDRKTPGPAAWPDRVSPRPEWRGTPLPASASTKPAPSAAGSTAWTHT